MGKVAASSPSAPVGEVTKNNVILQKVQKKKRQRKLIKSGVVYIKHIPHGFYEDEMKGFFSQFGKVDRVTVARSSKTGNSKGYGYLQFSDPAVAKIAAETMNNYLMFEKIVKCEVLSPQLVTSATFANASRRPGKNCPGQKRGEKALELLTAHKGRKQKRNALVRRTAAQRRTVARLAELGVKYDLTTGVVEEMEPVVSAVPAPVAAPPEEPEDAAPTVMEVDESDEEITFKTPPNTLKRVLAKTPTASTPTTATATQKKTPVKTPVKASTPAKTPVKASTPAKTPVKASTPAKTPVKASTPAKTPVEASTHAKTPVKASTPAKTPVKASTPAKTPVKTSTAKTPIRAKTPRGSTSASGRASKLKLTPVLLKTTPSPRRTRSTPKATPKTASRR